MTRCHFTCVSKAWMLQHIKSSHLELLHSTSEHFKESSVQTLFDPQPIRYFAVNLQLQPTLQTTTFQKFLTDILPTALPAPPAQNTSPNDIPPLLQHTRWHEHLADIRNSKVK